MVKINWTTNALQDLNDIGEYIAKDSQKYAELTVQELFFHTDILEIYPKTGKKVEEFNDSAIRELIKGSYRIVYKIISDEQIDILTVHNCARLLSNIKTLKKKKK
jgi:addiction module RelE/StbE family toxin